MPIPVHRILVNFDKWQPSEEEWQKCLSLVEPEEKERIGKFKRLVNPPLVGRSNPDAKSSLLGRLLMRYIVHNDLGIPYDEIKFGRTKENKPYLKTKSEQYPHFNFNVSHAGKYVAFASEPEYLIGIDVMECKVTGRQTIEEFFTTMKSCFTPYEWQAINSSYDDEERIKLFFVHWCLKEAYIKAVGIGLGFELQRAQFQLNSNDNPTEAILLVDNRLQRNWKFIIETGHDNHVVASAVGLLSESIDSFKATLDMTSAKKEWEYKTNERVQVLQATDIILKY